MARSFILSAVFGTLLVICTLPGRHSLVIDNASTEMPPLPTPDGGVIERGDGGPVLDSATSGVQTTQQTLTVDPNTLTCSLGTCLQSRGFDRHFIGTTIHSKLCPLIHQLGTQPIEQFLGTNFNYEGARVIANCSVSLNPIDRYGRPSRTETTECEYLSDKTSGATNFDFECKGGSNGFWETRPECYFVDQTVVYNLPKGEYVGLTCVYKRNPNPRTDCDFKDEVGASGIITDVICLPIVVPPTTLPPVIPPGVLVAETENNIILLVMLPIAGILLLLAIVSIIILLARRCWPRASPKGSGGFGPWPAGGWGGTMGSDKNVLASINQQMDEMSSKTPQMAAGAGGGGGGGNPNMPSETLGANFPNMPGGGGGGGNPNMPAEMMNGDFPNMPAGGGGGGGGNPNMPAEMLGAAFPNMPAGGGGGGGGNPNMPAEMMNGDFPNMPAGGGGGGAGGNGNPNMPSEMLSGDFPNMAAGGGGGGGGGNPNMPADMLNAEFPNMPAGGGGGFGAGAFGGDPNQPMDMIDAASFSAMLSGGDADAGPVNDITLDLYPQEETKMNPIYYE